MTDDLVCVTVVPNEAAAAITCGALRAAGIASMSRGTNMAGAWRAEGSLSGGPFEVHVARSDLERAQNSLSGSHRRRQRRTSR